MELDDETIIEELLKIYYSRRHTSNEFNLLHFITEVTKKLKVERIPLNSIKFLDVEEKLQRYGLVEKTKTGNRCSHCYIITNKGKDIFENGGWIKNNSNSSSKNKNNTNETKPFELKKISHEIVFELVKQDGLSNKPPLYKNWLSIKELSEILNYDESIITECCIMLTNNPDAAIEENFGEYAPTAQTKIFLASNKLMREHQREKQEYEKTTISNFTNNDYSKNITVTGDNNTSKIGDIIQEKKKNLSDTIMGKITLGILIGLIVLSLGFFITKKLQEKFQYPKQHQEQPKSGLK